jgi:hypothetical protein
MAGSSIILVEIVPCRLPMSPRQPSSQNREEDVADNEHEKKGHAYCWLCDRGRVLHIPKEEEMKGVMMADGGMDNGECCQLLGEKLLVLGTRPDQSEEEAYNAAESFEVGTGCRMAIPEKVSEVGRLLVDLALASMSRPVSLIKQMSRV